MENSLFKGIRNFGGKPGGDPVFHRPKIEGQVENTFASLHMGAMEAISEQLEHVVGKLKFASSPQPSQPSRGPDPLIGFTILVGEVAAYGTGVALLIDKWLKEGPAPAINAAWPYLAGGAVLNALLVWFYRKK